MGYKIPDLKEDIQEDIIKLISKTGMKRYKPPFKRKLTMNLLNIVDKHFEKIERPPTGCVYGIGG